MSFYLNLGQKIQNKIHLIYGQFGGHEKRVAHFMGEINLRRIRYSTKKKLKFVHKKRPEGLFL